MAEQNRKLVDSRGSACPGPITDLALAYRDSKVGDVIELWATDQGIKADVKAWAEKTGNRIVSINEGSGNIVVIIDIVKR